MPDVFVGSVAVGVVPDARGWSQKLQSQLVPSAAAIGDEYGKTMGRKIADNMGSAGDKSADAFGSAFRKRLEAALKALPQAKLDADSTEADRKVAALRTRMEELLGKEIGIDLSSKEAMAELVKIDTGLEEVSRKAKDIRVTFDTKEARAQLALLRQDTGTAGGKSGGGILSSISGLFGGGGGGGAAAPALSAGGAAPAAASGGGGLLSNPYVWGAGISALPFVAQAAAGGIVAALGGALAGVGIAGAVLSGNLTKQWGQFTGQAKLDLISVGQAFVPVIKSILGTASSVLGYMTPLFAAVMQTIAGPFKLFADTILTSFTQPAVQTSIINVSNAFVAILKAFTPSIPGIVQQFANAITQIANAVSKNPKAFADFLTFVLDIGIYALKAIAVLAEVATWIETHWQIIKWIVDPMDLAILYVIQHWNQLRHETANIFDGIRHDIAHYWDLIFENTIGAGIRINQGVQNWLNRLFSEIGNIFDGIRHEIAHVWSIIWNDTIAKAIQFGHDIESWFNRLKTWIMTWWNSLAAGSSLAWDTIWNNTIGRAIRGASALMGLLSRLKQDIINWYYDAGNWLAQAGHDIISGLLNGIKSGMGAIGGWINANVVQPLVGAVKHFFGISSPSTVMMPLGRNLIAGLIHGMLTSGANLAHLVGTIFGGWPQALASLAGKSLVDVAKLPAKAITALGGLAGKVGGAISGIFSKVFGGGGSGVQRWAGTVAQALAMLGLPLSLGGQVLYQMQTESGGNPNAINLTDINAQMGDPSRGLLQTIGSTFAAYHVAGTSGNIYDPLANIAAAINYAVHTYGPSLMRGGMGMGSGHGYDTGGWWPPNTIGWNTSGQHELVVTQAQLRGISGGASGPVYNAHFDSLTGQAIEGHVRSAFQAMSITSGYLNRQGRRT